MRGVPMGKSGGTNFLKIHTMGKAQAISLKEN
jgi:hypothetical protein